MHFLDTNFWPVLGLHKCQQITYISVYINFMTSMNFMQLQDNYFEITGNVRELQ